MKNYCANLYNVGDLRYEEKSMPSIQSDEVLIKVKSCGICGSDLPRVFTKGTYHFPTVIGHEFSGVVVEDQSGEFTGKRVAVFPMLPCFECESCKAENYATCRNYDYYGSRRDGGMCEFIAVKKWNLVFLPDSVSFDEGAMLEPISVAHHAISKLDINKGDNLLITGAGPIGIIAGQWAKTMGANDVYYIDIDKNKIDLAIGNGFKEYTDGAKIDCALEGTGYSDALEKCLKAVSPFGRCVLMGNPAKSIEMTQEAYWYILRKELTVKGTWNSSYSELNNDWIASASALGNNSINVKKLISHRYKLSDVNNAFNMMNSRKESYCKVMLNTEEEYEK